MIVVAQGNEQVRAILSAKLVSLSYQVGQVPNGQALLECSRRHGSRISLFVIERELPGRSGIDCLREIREAGTITPVIVLADSFEPELVARLDRNTFLLPKPFQMSQLERIVRDVLNAEGQGKDRE